jgi:hypothetical protein
MEELEPTSNGKEARNEMYTSALAERRRRAQELLTVQREHFNQVEHQLTAYLDDRASQQSRGGVDQFAAQLQEQAEDLARQQAELSIDRAEIASQQAELELAREQLTNERQQLSAQQCQEQDQLDRRAAELQQAESKLKKAQDDLAAAQQELHSEVPQIAGHRTEIASQQAELELAREQLASERQKLSEQQRQGQDQLEQRAAELQQAESKLKKAQDDLAAAQGKHQNEVRQFAGHAAEITAQQAEMQLAREQLAVDRQQFSSQQRQEQDQLERRAAELRQAESNLKKAQNELAAAQEEQQSEVRQFAGRRERFDAQQLRLEKELEELEARREETRAQRRRIAQQLRVERTTLAQERQLLESELARQRKAFQSEAGRDQILLAKDREVFEEEMNRVRQQIRRDRQQLEEDLAALETARQQWEETRRAAEKHRTDQSADLLGAQLEVQQLVAALGEAERCTAEANEKLIPLQQAYDAIKLEIEQNSHGEGSGQKLSRLEKDRDNLAARVKELENQLADAEKQLTAAPPPADDAKTDELHRRFEMAVDDVRQLKRRNAQLEEELADYQAAASAKPASAPTGDSVTYDWETTKKRLLAELDQDAAATQGGRLTEDDRLSVEGTIRITDEMITQRDHEIAELKQLLSTQNDSSAESAERAAAESQILDQDAVVCEGRERITVLERELQEKLRQAEVELSVSRAKIARERSEVEELHRQLAAEKAVIAAQRPGQPTGANSPKKPGQRWLARLGLKENDTDEAR